MEMNHMYYKKANRTGFTLIELLVVMAIIALLLGILLPALNKARAKARQVKSATQLSQIHKGLITYASDEDGIFPTPSKISRRQYAGAFVPGKGAEDHLLNNHANVYSALIQRNFVSPQILVCPAEVNSRVVVDSDYDYSEYKPIQGSFWDMHPDYKGDEDPNTQGWDDDGFQSDLNGECNVSYATMMLVGQRLRNQWRDGMDSSYVVLGTRGPGEEDGTSYAIGANASGTALYENSQTINIFGGREEWFGNLCFNDGHMEYDNTFIPSGHSKWEDGTGNYNEDDVFVNEDLTATSNNANGAGKDAFITMCKEVTTNPDEGDWDYTGYVVTYD
jgi:prepilin-type N-terminal cleavage/methylation domain-containing protein